MEYEISLWLAILGLLILLIVSYIRSSNKDDTISYLWQNIKQHQATVSHINKLTNEKIREIKSLEKRNEELDNELKIQKKVYMQKEHSLSLEFEKKREELEKYKAAIEHSFESQSSLFPFVSQMLGDTYDEANELIADAMTYKSRPAISSANKVRAMEKISRKNAELAKMYENQMRFYEHLFPWLEEFKEIPPLEAYNLVHDDGEKVSGYDLYKKWLSPEEWKKLSDTKKNQLALDRYKKREKTNWEIGIDYERYVGYKYESQGFTVSYIGAKFGLEDMGRDLIAQKGDKTYIIQCKRWAKEKTIHEKHIFQLYGTSVLYKMDNPIADIRPLFVTTTTLSDVAKNVADYLGVIVKCEYPLDEYPLIKCNVSKDKEKIYHLPFDQQYDSVQIDRSKGECYAFTIEEAEANGFRHAYRWHGNAE